MRLLLCSIGSLWCSSGSVCGLGGKGHTRTSDHTDTRTIEGKGAAEKERERDKQCCVADEFVRHVGGERSEAGDLATPQPGPPLLPDRPSVA